MKNLIKNKKIYSFIYLFCFALLSFTLIAQSQKMYKRVQMCARKLTINNGIN